MEGLRETMGKALKEGIRNSETFRNIAENTNNHAEPFEQLIGVGNGTSKNRQNHTYRWMTCQTEVTLRKQLKREKLLERYTRKIEK